MNMASILSNNKHPLKILEETIELAISQLNGDVKSNRNSNFNQDEFWSSFVSMSKLVSHEATKLSIAVTKPPLPSLEEFKHMADNLEKGVLALLTTFTCLPIENGLTLQKIVKSSVISILNSVKTLCIEGMDPGSTSQLISVGNVWEQCNEVPKLPKDNQTAVLQRITEQLGLVNDALAELEESINESLENDLEWSEAEKQLLPYCKGLVKACKAVLKKTKGWISCMTDSASNTPSVNRLLDHMSTISLGTSSLVDDFVITASDVPINHGLLRNNASLILEHVLKFVNTLKEAHEIMPDCDLSWLDFLKQAAQHNYDKINDLALED